MLASTSPGCVSSFNYLAYDVVISPMYYQAALEANGAISKTDALALASVNVEALLGIQTSGLQGDLVVTRGGDLFGFSSKVVGVISPRRGVVDLL